MGRSGAWWAGHHTVGQGGAWWVGRLQVIAHYGGARIIVCDQQELRVPSPFDNWQQVSGYSRQPDRVTT